MPEHIAGFVPVPFWHGLAVFGAFQEVLGHGEKGKYARKRRTDGKSGLSSPRRNGGNYMPPRH